ncbi:MAG: hypothetical protein ACI8ZB_001766 [Desulforhopalus sp.]|jgi:uncharacterized protein YjbI with pentapeptide repeats
MLLLLCGCFLCSCAPLTQKQYQKNGLIPLSGSQLQSDLTGQTLHLEAIDFDAFIVFHENMSISATSHDGDSDTGIWSLPDDNLICMKFKSWYFGDERCYRVIRQESRFSFFSPNGAISYTGTTSPQASDSQVTTTVVPATKASSATEQDPEVRNTTITNTSKETARDRFVRLAKNCPDCNFSGVDFSSAELNHANLAGADLSGADFTNANLRQANLQGANLTNTILIRANLAGANLSSADLSRADLSGSNLIRANVTNATFDETKLTGAHLESIQGKIQ